MVIVVFLQTKEGFEKLGQLDRDLADAKFNDLEDIRIGLHPPNYIGDRYAFLRKVKEHFPLMSKRSTFKVDFYWLEHYLQDMIEYAEDRDTDTSRDT